MINNEAFSKRLKILLDFYNISAAQLAEKISVQRSSISHLLSGRNKPSLDFVLKILKAFPEVELYWLLNGTGKFPKEVLENQKNISPIAEEEIKKPEKQLIKSNATLNLDSEIERIVIFYKDGTFKNFNP